jgi:hypothetical protein
MRTGFVGFAPLRSATRPVARPLPNEVQKLTTRKFHGVLRLRHTRTARDRLRAPTMHQTVFGLLCPPTASPLPLPRRLRHVRWQFRAKATSISVTSERADGQRAAMRRSLDRLLMLSTLLRAMGDRSCHQKRAAHPAREHSRRSRRERRVSSPSIRIPPFGQLAVRPGCSSVKLPLLYAPCSANPSKPKWRSVLLLGG